MVAHSSSSDEHATCHMGMDSNSSRVATSGNGNDMAMYYRMTMLCVEALNPSPTRSREAMQALVSFGSMTCTVHTAQWQCDGVV